MINLTKGQSINLKKEGPGGLQRIHLGLGWDVAKPKGLLGRFSAPESIDLDASAAVFDAQGNHIDTVWFRQLQSKDGSIRHSGDNLTGQGDGDDEVITVDLTRLPSNVTQIVLAVSSFRGQNFSKVENAFCRVVNADDRQEAARYNLSATGNHTSIVIGKLQLVSGEWTFKALGEMTNGRTIQDIANDIRRVL